MKRFIAVLALSVASLCAQAQTYGTYLNPFSASSKWNSKPVGAQFDDRVIPTTYKKDMAKVFANISYPDINPGAYSTGVFKAVATDKPMQVYGIKAAGIYDKDAEARVASVTIPRWPAGTFAAVGSDGHCDIVDTVTGVIHSFWQLRYANGRWEAEQYTWADVKGEGWGEGAHFALGPRAAGVPASAGLIRIHEVNDGTAVYPHALAISLDETGLTKTNPAAGYVPPATMADINLGGNSGFIPEGALLMLPPSYDLARLARWTELQKIARTLQTYGGYVVDRNDDTSFKIYTEVGANVPLHPWPAWDTALAAELEYMRSQLRMVKSVDRFVTAEGKTWVPAARKNVMSARGPWKKNGTETEVQLFDSLTQRLQFSTAAGEWKNTESGFKVAEFKPKRDQFFKLYTETDCAGAWFEMTLYSYSDTGVQQKAKTTGRMTNYSSVYIKWPNGAWGWRVVNKPATAKACSMLNIMVPIDEAEYNAGASKF